MANFAAIPPTIAARRRGGQRAKATATEKIRCVCGAVCSGEAGYRIHQQQSPLHQAQPRRRKRDNQ